MVCEAQAQPLPLTLVSCCGTCPGCPGIASLYFALNLDRGAMLSSVVGLSFRPPSISHPPSLSHRDVILGTTPKILKPLFKQLSGRFDVFYLGVLQGERVQKKPHAVTLVTSTRLNFGLLYRFAILLPHRLKVVVTLRTNGSVTEYRYLIPTQSSQSA